jgi:diacylglycerol kinase family enzyme
MPLPTPAFEAPTLDPLAPLCFIVNAAAGHAVESELRQAVEAVMAAEGRSLQWLACTPPELVRLATQAAQDAQRSGGALVAVGGDGTINTVAQAAHAAGCAMGVVPQGTFNYFARVHGLPADPADATALLLRAQALPVQVAAVNDRLFLVNASLGLYPDLLEDREAYKARWGRSRWVAFWAGCATLLHAQRRLRLRIELGGQSREVRALTLFVGNNRLQLEQLGVQARAPALGLVGDGSITAVMLRPVGTLTMLRLMLRGALGTLGEAEDVERFAFTRMVVSPARLTGRRRVKVAFDGEVDRMQAPLTFRVHERALYLLKDAAAPGPAAEGARA